MRVLGYIAARMGIALFTMLAVSLIVFIAMRQLPGGFELIVLGPIQTEAGRAAVIERFGLDRSLPEQFFSWLLAVLQGNFGNSMITQSPVADELLHRAPATIQLALMAVVMALAVGLPLGVLAGIGDASRKVKIGARIVGGMGRAHRTSFSARRSSTSSPCGRWGRPSGAMCPFSKTPSPTCAPWCCRRSRSASSASR